MCLGFVPNEKYLIADIIAKEYGLGGARTLTEFIENIENDDIYVVYSFCAAINHRHEEQRKTMEEDVERAEEGIETPKHFGKTGKFGKIPISQSIEKQPIDKGENKTEKYKLMSLFRQFGKDVKYLKNKEIEANAIDDSEFVDVPIITGKQMVAMSKEEFREYVKKLNYNTKKSVAMKIDMKEAAQHLGL